MPVDPEIMISDGVATATMAAITAATSEKNTTSRPPPQSSRRALGNSVVLASYYAFDAGLLFLLNLLLARYLGVAGFGKLAFALSYGLILSALDPGFQLVLTKFVARNPQISNPWIGEAMSIRVFMTAGLIVLGALPLLFQGYLRANGWLIFVVASSELIRSITLSYCALWRGFQVMYWEPLIIGVERLAVVASCWILLRTGHGPTAVGAVLLTARTSVLLFAAWLFYTRVGAFHFTFRPKILREIVRESLPLATLSMADRVKLYLPAVVLAYTAGEAFAGLFQAANKIIVFPILINGVAGAGIFPAMSAAAQGGAQLERLYRYGVRILWHVLLPFSVFLLFFAGPLIGLVFGQAYRPASTALQILVPFCLCNVIVTMSYYLMTAMNRQLLVMKLALLATAANIVIGIGMMKFFGVRGAAVTLLATETLVAFAYWRNVRRLRIHVFRTREDLYQWVGFAFCGAACFLLKRVITGNHWLPLSAVGVGVTTIYFVFLLSTRSLLPQEIRLLTELKNRFLG
jgi:O-antigen/teichoic acid export membrane protein